jgi:hypothetical protein
MPTILLTTQHHPFWDQTTQTWTNAADLTPGHHLLAPDGTTVTITAVRNHPDTREMRDLTVADTHTYYVIAGDTPVLVHNTNLGGCRVVGGAPGTRPNMPFTRAGKQITLDDNAAAHGGQMTCEICGEPLIPATQSRPGVTPRPNEARVDHMDPQSRGGSGDPSNGQGLCVPCNGEKGDMTMWEFWEMLGTLPNGGIPG